MLHNPSSIALVCLPSPAAVSPLPLPLSLPLLRLLMFYEGRLVSATNSPGSSSQIKASALEALGLGRKGQYLAEGFSFSGRCDDTSLDYINAAWTILT